MRRGRLETGAKGREDSYPQACCYPQARSDCVPHSHEQTVQRMVPSVGAMQYVIHVVQGRQHGKNGF